MVRGILAEWGMCSRTVTLDNSLQTLTCWRDTIAVGLRSGGIIILDGVTGSQTAILSGHVNQVTSLAFSPDGVLLVSGSYDFTVKLWDVQTGGVVKTFHGHSDMVHSVSISADCAMIASGSRDRTIRLWDIQTEKGSRTIRQRDLVVCVKFSPTDPQHLMFVSGDKIQRWDINSYHINFTHKGSNVAFSSDGTQFVSCQEEDIMVQNTDSGAITAKFQVADSKAYHCCFSPDGRHIAVAVGSTAYIWDTIDQNPHPIQTILGHSSHISSLAFPSPSSLISSGDQSVKFWQIGVQPTDSVIANPKSVSLPLAQIESITLQAKDGIAISSHSDGVMRIWDISTGLCKESLQTPAQEPNWSDAQLINRRLICVWHKNEKLHIWGVGDGEPQVIDAILDEVEDFRMSGDGTKVFYLCWRSIQAWSTLTGEVVDKVQIKLSNLRRSLRVDGSRVWVQSPFSEPLGWDFGVPGSPPIQLSNASLFHPNGTKSWNAYQSRIKDAVTGKVVFHLGGKFVNPVGSQWDGQYLVAGYESGEVLILDFNSMLS